MPPITQHTFKVFIATSLDGYIALPNGDISWLTDPPPNTSHLQQSSSKTAQDAIQENLDSVKYIVMGRGSYEKVLEMGVKWPYGVEDGDEKAMVKVVRSVEEIVEILKPKDAGGVYVDGGKTIRAFLEEGLIDDITVTTAPVILGQGIPLFTELLRGYRLLLIENFVLEGGMVLCKYRVHR